MLPQVMLAAFTDEPDPPPQLTSMAVKPVKKTLTNNNRLRMRCANTVTRRFFFIGRKGMEKVCPPRRRSAVLWGMRLGGEVTSLSHNETLSVAQCRMPFRRIGFVLPLMFVSNDVSFLNRHS